MINVKLRVKPVKGATKEYLLQIPQSWKEVKPELITAICAAKIQQKSQWLLNNLLSLFIPTDVYLECTPNALQNLHRYIEWMLTVPLSWPVLPAFRAGALELYLPMANFADVAVDEWADGQAAMLLYEKTKNPMYLNACISTFCRPLRPGYDANNPDMADNPRETYSGTIAMRRADLIEEIPALTKLYVSTFIMSSTQAVINHPDYAILFPKLTPEQQAQKQLTQPKPDPAMWYNFAIEAAALPNLGGDYEKVLKKKIHDVLRAVALHRKAQNY